MRQPRLCFLSMNAFPLLDDMADSRFCGGAERQQYQIGTELVARGYDVHFVTEDEGQGERCLRNGITVHGAYVRGAGLPVLRFFHPRLSGLLRALKRTHADVYVMRGAGFALAPVVFVADRRGAGVLFAGASDTDFDPQARHLPLARDRFFYWWGLRRVDGVIVQNRDQARAVRSALDLDPPIVHNGLPSVPTGVSSRETVLWVGNIRPRKSPERFLDLAEAFPGQRFVMVGGCQESAYPDGLRSRSGQLAEEIPNLELTGYLPPSAVETQYSRAKVVVNTSDVEGFPNTFLHAWSWGVPVLSYVDPDGIVAAEGLGWVAADPVGMMHLLGGVISDRLHASAGLIQQYCRSTCSISRQVDAYEEEILRISCSIA